MGEANRRKRLDSNYGNSLNIGCFIAASTSSDAHAVYLGIGRKGNRSLWYNLIAGTFENKGEKTMTSVKPTRTVRRGRLFPEIQWSEEKKAQWRAEREAFYQRCKPTFDRLKPELIKTHYNWYMAVEPDSGDYFIDKDDMVAGKIAHEKYPKAKLHVFRINETGVCGTI